MNNILAFLETKVAPFGEKVGNQRHLKAIREGFMMAMPLILVGSLFLILISWPQEAFTNWLNSVGLLSILTTMNQSTVAIISLVACFGIAYLVFRVWFMIKMGSRSSSYLAAQYHFLA